MEEFNIDNTELSGGADMVAVEIPRKATKETRRKKVEEHFEEELVSCLRNETVIVRYIPNEKTGITDTKHPFYGGLVDNATITYTVPMLKNGTLKNPLTDSEKAFLEDYLGLEYNALSIHKKNDNYWENFAVRLSKVDTILKLSDPLDYIKYKVLLTNKDFVADSLETLRETPRETYRFVVISDSEVYSSTSERTNAKSKCWKEFGKVEDNFDILRCIIETIDGRPVGTHQKIEFLRDKIDKLIDSDPRRFLSVIEDPLLNTKVLIKKAVDARVVDRRGEFYYYNSEPLCGSNEEPTFTVAAKFLGAPKNQEIKFSIEAKLKQ